MRSLEEDLRLARQSLPSLPQVQPKPVLILLSGLPGTGKTYLSRRLEERLPVVAVRTDEVRKVLFPHPAYKPGESYWVYRVCRALAAALLCEGRGVILDGTNLSESGRREFYDIADRCGARLLILKTEAPEEVVRQRLLRRQTNPPSWDRSDATWEVYEGMKRSVERIRRSHRVVDTTADLATAVDRLVEEVLHEPQDEASGTAGGG